MMEQDNKPQAVDGGDSKLLLHAYLDDELSLPETIAANGRLAADPALAAEAATILRLKQRLREKLPIERAPARLQARIEKSVGLRRRVSQPMWRALAASLVVAVVGSALATSTFMRLTEGEMLDNELIDNHVRALVATKPVDVVSTDQHTVKPWFNGKSILAPEVVDLSAQGYPLVGGRIDVIRNAAVPVVVYSRRLHVINVWALPPALLAGVGNSARAVLGYNILPFKAHGASYVAASDLAGDELAAFTKLLQDAQ
jgi:anti-sigma factor RsiW